MSAATIQAPLPLYEEGNSYWEQLTQECKRHMDAINATASANRIPKNRHIKLFEEEGSIRLVRDVFPSTEVRLSLAFEHWGPKICGSVKGYEEHEWRFYPEEFEYALGHDPDAGIVAITGEGRSIAPSDFARYVAQQFRRSFPGMTLP